MISLQQLRDHHRERARDRSCARMLRLWAARQTLAVNARRGADPMERPPVPLQPRRSRICIAGSHMALGGHGVATLVMDPPRTRMDTAAQHIARDPHPRRRPPAAPG